MFRKHGGWKFNQHIRIIQRLVPRRQHFSHHPIQPSRSISPPLALPSQDVLGHLPAAASFSGLCSVLIVHWPGFTITVRLSLSVVPVSFTLSFVLLHWGGGNIWIAHIYFLNFFLYSCLKYNTTGPENVWFYLGSQRAINYESSLPMSLRGLM